MRDPASDLATPEAFTAHAATERARSRAFVARTFTPKFEKAIAARFDVIRPTADLPVPSEEIVALAKGCDTLFVTATEQVSPAVVEALAPTLRTIATLSVGFDHIALEAARRHDIAVLTTPDVLSAACAEIALLLVLNAARRGHEANLLVRSGDWPGWAPTQMLGLGLSGRRLGILGMGRIGREVAVRGAAFGMAIHYHNRTRLSGALERGATYHAALDDLLRESDVFCICAPGGPGLNGLLNRDRIARLPADAIVVNIARGDVIDDDALIAALTDGRLFAAGLDVFRGEPSLDPRYAALPNVFLTPHIGSSTVATREAMGALLIAGIDALARGETPDNRVI